MATIQFTIPDDIQEEAVLGISTEMGYQEQINGEDNPQSRGAFVKEQTVIFWKDYYRRYKLSKIDKATAIAEAEELTKDIN